MNTMNKFATVITIKTLVAECCNIPIIAIDGKTRIPEVNEAREIAVYFANKKTGMKPAEISNLIGFRSRTTTNRMISVVKGLIEVDKNFRKKIELMEMIIDNALNESR